MSAIAALVASHGPAGTRQDGSAQRPGADEQAIAVARQALHQAQGRVDADHRAHSPGCVAVDQKGVDKASAELAQAQSAEKATQAPAPGGPAQAASRALSITV